MKSDRRMLGSGATAVALGAIVTGTALARSHAPGEQPPAAASEVEVHEDD